MIPVWHLIVVGVIVVALLLAAVVAGSERVDNLTRQNRRDEEDRT